MTSEIIRWQTPLSHMRRTATQDTELAGKSIAKGDKVVMWYVSANRDESVFERPNEFRIDRENARRHLSFGIGVHFCMGSRLAEMQLRVLWEETMARFRMVEVVESPQARALELREGLLEPARAGSPLVRASPAAAAAHIGGGPAGIVVFIARWKAGRSDISTRNRFTLGKTSR